MPQQRRRNKVCKLFRLIDRLLDDLCPPATRLDLRFGLPEPKQVKPNNTMTEIKITNAQKVKVTLNPVSQSGKPVELDGTPSWSVQSGDSTVEPAEDGKSAYLISSDVPGVTEIVVTADADLGEGVEEIAAGVILTVEGEKATSLGLEVSPAEDK